MMNRLCCCEYIDNEGERNHILACCCNCQELDFCFDRLITCKRVPKSLLVKLMTTAQDRLRIPWKGGAKRLSFGGLLPIIIFPLFLLCAAQGLWISVVTYSFLPIFLVYAHFICTKFYPQTNFFYAWNVTSTLVIFLIFECVGVSLLEIRNDENFVFICLSAAVLFCIYKVKQKEKLSFAVNVIEEGDLHNNKVCSECNIVSPPRTFHCDICQACVYKRDQHCTWLNCCIGQNNHIWFMMFLMSNFSQLVFCSNLILTTACHPFIVWGSIMLPDDCSDVFFDSLFALCFVIALYCIESAIFVAAIILHECWLISLGITGHEFRNRSKRSNCCGIFMSRPYSKGVVRNWLFFWRGIEGQHVPHKI